MREDKGTSRCGIDGGRGGTRLRAAARFRWGRGGLVRCGRGLLGRRGGAASCRRCRLLLSFL